MKGAITPPRAIEGLCAALLPPEAGGPDSGELAAHVTSFLACQPPAVRAAFRAGAGALDAAAILRHGRRLADLDIDVRESALARAAALPGGDQLVTGVKALVLLVAGAAAFSDETLAAAQKSEPARPDAVLDVTPSLAWPSTTRCDVAVVGSGAGGATAARVLARAGMDVVVIEEGRRHTVDELRTTAPIDRFAAMYRDGGSTTTLGRPPIVLPIGRAVGGTTVVNSGTCYRTPPRVLRRWRDRAGLTVCDPETFSVHLDTIEQMLEVAPVPLDIMGQNGLLALAGARVLGWKAGPLLRNAPGCGGCCQCVIGCPRNAKFGVHLNALPDACAAGARIVSNARAEEVVVEEARAAGVRALRSDGSMFTVFADHVVVAAGATETPPLLKRSGIGRHPRLGKGLAIHPAVSAAGWFDKPVVAWHGVMQSAGIEQFHEIDGILVEATSTPPGLGSMILPGHGRALLGALENADHMATLGAMVADEPAGRVLGTRRAVLRYDITPRDGRRLIKAIGVMARVLFAAGATTVLTGIPGAMIIASPEEIDGALARARTASLHVAAFHPTGTASAGSDPSHYPVDASGRLRGVRGVWVLDASILPSSPEVNPQVSIMALADALASGVLMS